MAQQNAGRVLIYGGRGALGSKVISHFKSNNYWVSSVDLHENTEADINIILDKDQGAEEQGKLIISKLNETLKDDKLDAIICVAGGWAGGNASKDLLATADLMWKQSVWSSVISANLASAYLKEGGLLTLTGAQAALEATPGMIGYGLAKAAVHHLVKSLGAPNSGLPKDATTAAILPITLDTPMNRKWMPKADFSTWTPLEFVADLFLKWTKKEERPASGSLCQLITTENVTKVLSAP